MTEEIKAVSYCVGMSIAESLKQQDLDKITPEVLAEAVKDVFAGEEPKYSPNEANSIIQSYINTMNESKFGAVKKKEKLF